MIYIMEKALVLSLSLFLLCGCASQNIDSSEDKKDEAKTTAVTTTARTTSSSTVTTSHTITTTIATPTSVVAETTSIADADDFVWLERGVYEVGYGERKPDLPYDNRFEGVFYSFFDDNTGVKWDAYEGVVAYFSCEQKKDSIIFHETNLTKNNPEAEIGATYDYERRPSLDNDGNIKLDNSILLVRLSADEKEYEPGLFDARDYSDNYVFNDGLKAINSPNFLGKKLEK